MVALTFAILAAVVAMRIGAVLVVDRSVVGVVVVAVALT